MLCDRRLLAPSRAPPRCQALLGAPAGSRAQLGHLLTSPQHLGREEMPCPRHPDCSRPAQQARPIRTHPEPTLPGRPLPGAPSGAQMAPLLWALPEASPHSCQMTSHVSRPALGLHAVGPREWGAREGPPGGPDSETRGHSLCAWAGPQLREGQGSGESKGEKAQVLETSGLPAISGPWFPPPGDFVRTQAGLGPVYLEGCPSLAPPLSASWGEIKTNECPPQRLAGD